jgi:NAD(P)-dependent dehydrogenase (short-subunit alcohol dehydrogenase family)
MQSRIIIITGAASGIGRATALHLGSQGVILGLLDIQWPQDVAKEIEESGGTAIAYQCDVANNLQVEETVRSFIDRFGPLTGKKERAVLSSPIDAPRSLKTILCTVRIRYSY